MSVLLIIKLSLKLGQGMIPFCNCQKLKKIQRLIIRGIHDVFGFKIKEYLILPKKYGESLLISLLLPSGR